MGWLRFFRLSDGVWALALGCLAVVASTPAALAQNEQPPNIALVILDDVGVELIGAYTNERGKEVGWPRPTEHFVTPNIETLARAGLLFRNAWSAPLCGPTRFSLFTGLYGFHTGAIERARDAAFVPATLAQRLRDASYAERIAIGKWHLSGYEPYHDLEGSPTALGFTSYAGNPINGPYLGYVWVTDPPPARPVMGLPREYLTEKEVSEAIAFVERPHDEPWLLWLALHAAHAPWDEAETPANPASSCQSLQDVPRRVRCRQLEILDAELGRLLQALEAADPGLARTTVILVGDNGSPTTTGDRPEAIPRQLNRGAKGSIYEGGINVPLIVAGAGVAPNHPDAIDETDALVHVVDVFATVLDLAAVPSPDAGHDGVSFAPVLAGAPGPRSCVYADGLRATSTVSPRAPANHDVAIRDARYKLIRRAQVVGTHDYEFYDIVNDRSETTPLPESGLAFEALRAELDAIDRSRFESPCKLGERAQCGLGLKLVPALLALAALLWVRRQRA